MTTNTDITRIFKEFTFTSEFKYTSSISINKKTTMSIIDNQTIVNIGDNCEFSFSNDKEKIEVFKNRIDVYTLTNKHFYKNNHVQNIAYKQTQGFILNKHIVKIYPHRNFVLNKTIIVNFKNTLYTKVYFVFDIEDKRETYANALNQIVNQHNIPPEIIDPIALDLGMTKPTKYDGIYDKSQFPFNFVSKYTQQHMPDYFIKEQLIELYELGILKIAVDDYCGSSLNILTDEAYDYIFPNGKPNQIKEMFSSKQDMHDFIDDILDEFFNE